MGNFWVRTATTLVGGGAVLGLLYRFPFPSTWGLATLIALGLVLEATRLLLSPVGGPLRAGLLAMALLLMGAAGPFLPGPWRVTALIVVSILGPASLGLLVVLQSARGDISQQKAIARDFASSVFIWIFLIVPVGYLPTAVEIFGVKVFFFLLLTMWANDIGAYLVGSLVGRNRLAPSISPKKTVEGSLGGVLIALGVAYGFHRTWLPHPPLAFLLGVAFVLSLAGQVGDLIESLFKRAASQKDSGNLIPGHGGMWDRFDSFVFCLPVWYIAILFGLGNR